MWGSRLFFQNRASTYPCHERRRHRYCQMLCRRSCLKWIVCLPQDRLRLKQCLFLRLLRFPVKFLPKSAMPSDAFKVELLEMCEAQHQAFGLDKVKLCCFPTTKLIQPTMPHFTWKGRKLGAWGRTLRLLKHKGKASTPLTAKGGCCKCCLFRPPPPSSSSPYWKRRKARSVGRRK